ncbi:MAG: DJ-1/PfpI family protein [Muribaculaceae bacterium]|nr:DJ-1/PfpI family protein [Muribaculaceae bacterium]
MGRVYVFLADGFEEIEALTAVDVLRRAGVTVVTVSVMDTPEVVGAHDVIVTADAMFSDYDCTDADWLVLPGGMPGASNLAACEPLCELLKVQASQGRGVAAICASPSIVLGPLGLLQGKRAVCYPGMEAGMEGATLVREHAVTDGNIITGQGPASAASFALAIVAALVGEETAAEVAQGMLLA